MLCVFCTNTRRTAGTRTRTWEDLDKEHTGPFRALAVVMSVVSTETREFCVM
jgi:hypothetical protein